MTGVGGDLIERVDDPVQPRVVDRRGEGGGRVQPARRRQRLAATDPAGQPAPRQRTPHHRADALIEAERHQLPFVVATGQRVVRLVRDIARQSVAVGDRQCLHQLPARVVGRAEVAHLAGTDQAVERRQRFLQRRHRIERVQLQQVDVVGVEPAQSGVDGVEQMHA